jgi:hypothetical protein
MSTCGETVPSLRKSVILIWRALTRDLSDPYRPELHYMRGPGPKWREKHGGKPVTTPIELTAPLAEVAA